MKVIKSLDNRGVLLQGPTREVTSQEVEFLNVLRQLMTAGLPLTKNVLTFLTKSVHHQQHQQQIQMSERKLMDQVQQH